METAPTIEAAESQSRFRFVEARADSHSANGNERICDTGGYREALSIVVPLRSQSTGGRGLGARSGEMIQMRYSDIVVARHSVMRTLRTPSAPATRSERE